MKTSVLFAFVCLAVVAFMTTSAEKVEGNEPGQELVNNEGDQDGGAVRLTCDIGVGNGPCNWHCKLMGKSGGSCQGKTCVCFKSVLADTARV